MPIDLSVRPVALHDYNQWLPLWEGYNAFYGRSGPTALPPEITETTWARFFDAYEPMHALVAEHAGQLLGLTHYLFHRSTTSRKGVGRALISAVYERARHAGCPRVYWQTHETNGTARKLYDTLAEDSGFVVYRKLL